ncbi:hypothetical protein HHI36_017541 [Cryptolaemus montrouzieri]|uniref:Uncharacterized protein n=1 Tax=Cryptolaemus montrouzieri TaxID=559131 RepID=A0ABD2NN74_9CUCU
MPDIIDITVEEPSESFQKLRDICDSIHIYSDLQSSNSSLVTKSQKIFRNYMAKHKICKRQGLRLSDILQYYNALKSGNGEVKSFTESLSKRMESQLKTELVTHKRARGLVTEESEDFDALLKENLIAKVTNYLGEIKPIAEKLEVLLK